MKVIGCQILPKVKHEREVHPPIDFLQQVSGGEEGNC
jgi:hypothetical protein